VITLVLHGELRQFSPGGMKQLSVEGAGKTALNVVRELGIPAAETAAFIVNGEQRDGDAVLRDGDTLEALPAISGGVAEGALAGIRVVDLTRALAGPYCTLMLADHGADVIKVELPGTGDETRTWAPPHINGVSAYYLSINRNKRSLTLDLKHPDGANVLERLIEQADVVVENFSPGTLARLGFPKERIRALNPRAVLCQISGFGQDGPGRAWAAYDLIVQGMGGIMSLTGKPGGDPVMVGVPQADMVAGMFAAFAILAALHARERTGEGQTIDATMIGGQVALLSRQAARYFADGTVPRPEGNVHSSIVPYQTFRAVDGFVNVCCGNNALFARLCAALDLDDVADDERFADNGKRVENRTTLIPILEKHIGSLKKDDVVSRLRNANVPVGPINDLADVFADPTVRHLGLIAEVDHPTAGRVRAPGIPVRMDGTPPSVRTHPPLLGEHTDAVLEELGYAAEEIAKLHKDGAV
jgi:formyl-CoA transferase